MKYLKRFESNLTIEGDKDLMDFHFGLSTDDIMNWCQDYLDEYSYDFKSVVKINRQKKTELSFTICFISDGKISNLIDGIKKEDFKQLIRFLNERLREYKLRIGGYRVFHDFEGFHICGIESNGIVITLELSKSK